MAKLLRNPQKEILLSDVKVAQSFFVRAVGLISSKDLNGNQGMWFPRCNSIHTFFMKFAIDCVFLDKSLKVKKIIKDVKPQRLVLPVWGADSVLEVKSGVADRLKLEIGDDLYVGA